MRIKLILLILIITSCSPRYKTLIQNTKEEPLSEKEEILVINNESSLDLEKASFIAEIKGPNKKFYESPKSITKGCGYTEIINDFKLESRKFGANIISIYNLKKPNSLNNCYKLKAKLYKSFDSNLLESINQYNNSRMVSKLDKDSDYAIVYLYRPSAITAMVVKFDIYLDNNTLITNLKNGDKTSYKIKDFGVHTFTAINQKGQKKEFSLDIKKGQEYYLRCGIDVAYPYAVAQFSHIDNITGDKEFNKIK
ncbi:hypothetical protein [Flavivirga jejuensis]|uniref:Uncharacterized protein n=1 Tax=Flavivirga jejuensis TaxID=870487 RepID=A0ABT8WT59_9FLAO|nr:hypothetical protein [Flavivirga jejuensis]MDO5976372.1 hypothetical protein [Flavivirga jejuensis]